ncbi:MAG: hypothetical protein ABH934_00030 [Chloroflexota bacterium]
MRIIISVMRTTDPLARDFILFCFDRCGSRWPALYDEMCRVAGCHLFHGMGYRELNKAGLSLGLNDIENTIKIVDTVIPKSPQPSL